MIAHTKSFTRLKEEAQAVLDFAIVVSCAVPALKYSLKDAPLTGELPFHPDYFSGRPIAIERVKESATGYKGLLSRYLFLSTFSFFEAYVVDVLCEVIEFHGYADLVEYLSVDSNASMDGVQAKAKRALQEYKKNNKLLKYKKAKKTLADSGFRFPTAHFARYGVEQLHNQLSNGDVRASRIPDMLKDVLQLSLDQTTEIDVFSKYRQMRNDIAHGRSDAGALCLSAAIGANEFFRNLALKIDKHVLENYLVVEII